MESKRKSNITFIDELRKNPPILLDDQIKARVEALNRFYNLLAKEAKSIKLTTIQKSFIESIFNSDAFIPMLPERTGKTTLFQMIDSFMAGGELDEYHWHQRGK